MESLLPLLLLISLTSVIGLLLRAKKGVIKKGGKLKVSEGEFGGKYGSRLTILQFSTTFCSECRTAKAIVQDVVKPYKDISYVEVDAESNLDLVREFAVTRTPTTFILDGTGMVIGRAVGLARKSDVLASLAPVLARANPSG